jgi:hypothetical protein
VKVHGYRNQAQPSRLLCAQCKVEYPITRHLNPQSGLAPKGYGLLRARLLLGLPGRTIHKGTPFSDFSIFAPFHTFFGIFFNKIGIYDLDLTYTIKPKTLQSNLNPTLNRDQIFPLWPAQGLPEEQALLRKPIALSGQAGPGIKGSGNISP